MDQKTADSSYAQLRRQMVREQLEGRDIRDRLVLKAMETVPRHLFVPAGEEFEAYADRPLPIGEGQTISQPYIVALMSQLLGLKGGEKVLEIGTGSGYQAAVLEVMGARVFSIEIICTLADRAREKLGSLGYKNIQVRCADGYRGWPEEAPFDGVIVTAAPTHVPQPLIDQLKDGGRLVIPVGDFSQELVVITKHGGKAVTREVIPVRFVPMTGEAEKTRVH
ncbi:MAG: protein-L-isoaspartate(D-aspartate) O-methyltransferase [Acidobacteriota bacterium]